ncbi:MAG: hypothetical protein A2014_06565 [Spirochaetes bacterium GWF1_49_6]|nr:MAG: hypothetical protein A2014_06565 [Spirochaetes bacterium GWF1_49_6]
MSALKNIFKVFGLVTIITIGISASSHAAILLFKGKGFFLMNMALDISNVLINPTGTGQPYLNNLSYLKFNMFPTLEDKNFKTTMKFKVNPTAASADYLVVEGFNFIYDTDTANITLFVNRFGFRFKDPMFSGLENYSWEYSKYGYDKPVYFSYNNSIHTSAFYDGKTRDEFMRLGYGLSGLYLAGKGTVGYEIAGYINKWQSSSHIQADLNFNLDTLKFGVIAKVDNHPNTDIAKGSAYNLTNIHNGLTQKYNNAFVVYSAGLFGNINLMDMMNIFIEGLYRTGSGQPGTSTAQNNFGMLDVYGGLGTDMFPGTDLEVAVQYRNEMTSNFSRMDITVKDFNDLDFGEIQLTLLGSVNIMSGKNYGTDMSGLAVNLSTRIPIMDMIGIRIAGSFESFSLSTNTGTDLTLKATVEYYFDETTLVYAGITMYNLMSDLSGKTIYEGSYFLPVVGFISSPFETLRLALTFGYDVQIFEYDFDGANQETMVSKKTVNTIVGSDIQVYATDWMSYVANPSIAFTAMITF